MLLPLAHLLPGPVEQAAAIGFQVGSSAQLLDLMGSRGSLLHLDCMRPYLGMLFSAHHIDFASWAGWKVWRR